MANYWAITIGINQYRHLQPLMHAQNDALFLHRFFTDKSDVPSDNCVLLSDLATSVGQQVAYPDKPAIAEWVQTITQQVGPDDVLWFFFSGYGVQLEGADYLMPIDGDPNQIKDSGLAIADLIDTLAGLPTPHVFLVLDMNRSQGSFSGQTIGTQVIQLAQDKQIPTLLSCQPEQYSHETFGVRHGLFTAALLEALQQECRTTGQISDYISKRLPELCEHHWRPIQNVVSLLPEAQRDAVVAPEARLMANVSSTAVSETEVSTVATAPENYASESYSSGNIANSELAQSGQVLAGSAGTLLATESTNGNGTKYGDTLTLDRDSAAGEFPEREYTEGERSNALTIRDGSSAIVRVEQPEPSTPNGAKLRNWGLLILAVLMGLVLLKQPFVRTAWLGLRDKIAAVGGSAETAEAEAENSQVAAPQPEGENASDASLAANSEGATAEAETETETDASEATASADDAEENEEATATDSSETAGDSDAETSSEAADADAADTPEETAAQSAEAQEKAAATELIAQANAAVAQRKYSEALILLQKVPRDQRDNTFSETLTKARSGSAEARQFNASVLTDARTSIQPTQASQFTDAIAKARLIQPGEPYYEEAQQDIRSWSQIILDIAEGRATSGDLDGAIAAANVMPPDNAEFRQKAEDGIAFWQQRQRSREIIAEAQQIPKSGQASTYQQGIVKLREVPIEHPEYETAQRLADDWSERIFSIAQARAAQGRSRAAIQAAILVPAGTTAYEPTQQAIRRWQSEI
ncbi:MAG: caspase family protein [Cyanobacteria bacterium J06632_3]